MNEPEYSNDDTYPPPEIPAGRATAALLANPRSWIRRRVETIDLLAHEEIHRRVSIDFALTPEQANELEIGDGVAVPISALSKERRRNFSLRDESGRAVPVLGKDHNTDLAHIALSATAYQALPEEPSLDELTAIMGRLRNVVALPAPEALDEVESIEDAALAGDAFLDAIVRDPASQSLLWMLAENYVLFAVLAPNGPSRRILKYSYSEDLAEPVVGRQQRLRRSLSGFPWAADRERFVLECPRAGAAASFHLEITTADELRFTEAVLYVDDTLETVSEYDRNVNRASLYPFGSVDEFGVNAYVEVAPERIGATSQAAASGVVIGALLWAGYLSDLDGSPGPAVSLLVAGAALYSGVSATRGEHRLVKKVFRRARVSLAIVTLAGLAASASLALEIPDERPTEVWKWAALVCTAAAVQRVWAALRAPT